MNHEAPVAEQGSAGERPVDFASASAHATRNVPVLAPTARADRVLPALAGQRWECASHVVVCDVDRFRGLVPIESLLAARGDQSLGALMDPAPPVVGPDTDQEVAAWTAMRRGATALAVVDGDGRFVGLIPPRRLIAVGAAEHEEDLSRLGGFIHAARGARRRDEEPLMRRFRHRIPWVLVGCAAGSWPRRWPAPPVPVSDGRATTGTRRGWRLRWATAEPRATTGRARARARPVPRRAAATPAG